MWAVRVSPRRALELSSKDSTNSEDPARVECWGEIEDVQKER
jgi:hypothetical protein